MSTEQAEKVNSEFQDTINSLSALPEGPGKRAAILAAHIFEATSKKADELGYTQRGIVCSALLFTAACTFGQGDKKGDEPIPDSLSVAASTLLLPGPDGAYYFLRALGQEVLSLMVDPGDLEALVKKLAEDN